MGLKITNSGLLTTIQDLGRHGFQKSGIIVSGAMDPIALRIGNLLVGNNENEGAIEITMAGPEIFFEQDQLISITGADLSPKINGITIKLWRPVYIRKGSTLTFGLPAIGVRSYLAVAGGLDTPKVLNSSSTYLRAAIGGWKGRALQAGDIIPTKNKNKENSMPWLHFAKSEPFKEARWTPSPLLYPAYNHSPTIRVLTGPEWKWFSIRSRKRFWEEEYMLTPQSDRMGLRLKGPALLMEEKTELLSGGVTFGTIQVPPDGSPIVLMADRATTGGYARIAQVITADIPILAQVQTGKTIKFSMVSLKEAQRLHNFQEQNMETIKKALQIKIGSGNYEQIFS